MGVVLWYHSDREAWFGAPVGIPRKDGSPKPSYDRLDTLINRRWRTRGDFTTDTQGHITIPHAFEGHYRITAGANAFTGDHRVDRPLHAQLRR
jgi:hypothetical protein